MGLSMDDSTYNHRFEADSKAAETPVNLETDNHDLARRRGYVGLGSDAEGSVSVAGHSGSVVG